MDAAEVAHLVSTDRPERTRIVFKSEPNAPVIEFVAAEDLSTISSKLAEALEIAPDQVPIGQPDKRATEHELSERRREWLQAQLARSHSSDLSLALRSRYTLRQIGLWLHGTKPISAQALQEMAQALSAVAPADLVDEL